MSKRTLPLFPPESKFRPDCRNGLAVEYLACPGKNNRFFHLDVVRIQFFESRRFGKYLLRSFRIQAS
jgi:hypothetical protein